MKYLRKSDGEIVKAFKYDGDMINRDGVAYVPKWAMTALNLGKLKVEGQGDLIIVKGEPNWMNIMVIPGNYLIQTKSGELWSVQEDEFLKAHEPVRRRRKTGTINLSPRTVKGILGDFLNADVRNLSVTINGITYAPEAFTGINLEVEYK